MSAKNRDIKEPARYRLVELALDPSKQVIRKPESYADFCKKKPQVSRTNSLARIKGSKKGLFSEEQALPQEVSKPTGNGCPFTTRADSKQMLQKVLDSNLYEKYLDINHLNFQRMDSHTRSTGNSSDSESDASLLEILRKMASYGSETAVSENNYVDWSEEALLSESDTETEAALKVAA